MIEKKADEKPVEAGMIVIVDPKSLGMESQAGEAPPARDEAPPPELKPDMVAARIMSINEPPGSNVLSKTVPPHGGQLPGMPPATRASHGKTNDPDDIEAELEAAKDDGDVVSHGSKKKR